MKVMTRRSFVGKSLAGAAAASAATGLFPAPRLARGGSPNNRVVLALMGAGGRGRDLMRKLAAIPDVAFKYICDAEGSRGDLAGEEVKKLQGSAPQTVTDLRRVLDDKDVHAVVIATPEQWHALGTVWACRAGKDVYVEKNITLGISEGPKMIQAARKYKRIVQAGTQNRSAPSALSARDYIAGGGLGKVFYAKVFSMLPGVVGGYPKAKNPDTNQPPGLDWDKWLGPARMRPYSRDVHRGWYGHWDFSGGNVSDAVHTLDVARLILGDPPHPAVVQCLGGRYLHDDGGDMPDVQIVNYQFDKLVVTLLNTGFTTYMQKTPGEIRMGDQFPSWPQNSERIEIYGSKRMMYYGRHGGGWQVFERDGKLVAKDKSIHPDKWHLPNFLDCIRTRNEPNGNLQQGHLSACLEHLANIAYRTGNQQLVFDGRTETFVGNDAANKLLKPYYREPYLMPEEV